jgi:hypothetical protein
MIPLRIQTIKHQKAMSETTTEKTYVFPENNNNG